MKSNKRHIGEFEEVVLLALTTTQGESYGKKIRDIIKEKAGREAAIGAIYTTLSRLEEKGYVSSKLGEATPERGGKPKRYFKLEALGRQALIDKQNRIQSFTYSGQIGETTYA